MEEGDYGINPYLKGFISALASNALIPRNKQEFEVIYSLIVTTVDAHNIKDGIDYKVALDKLKKAYFNKGEVKNEV